MKVSTLGQAALRLKILPQQFREMVATQAYGPERSIADVA